jgi:hypothetical protein
MDGCNDSASILVCHGHAVNKGRISGSTKKAAVPKETAAPIFNFGN